MKPTNFIDPDNKADKVSKQQQQQQKPEQHLSEKEL